MSVDSSWSRARTMSWRRAGVGALLALAASTHAHAQTLDPTFGPLGQRHLAFDSIGGLGTDVALVACAGPGRTLVVTGLASGGQRVVTARLRDDGTLDPSFSDDGKESFALARVASTTLVEHVGHCLPDGDALMALRLGGQDDDDILLVRVDGATGLPDPGFGAQGFVLLDLDAHLQGLAALEAPLGLNAAANGGVYLSGKVTLAANDVDRGFVARIDAQGQVLAVAAPAVAPYPDTSFTAVGDGPDGKVWAAGKARRISNTEESLFVALDPVSLALVGVRDSGTVISRAARGRLFGPALVTAGHRPGSNGVDQPVLLVHRLSGTTMIDLPPIDAIAGQTARAIDHDGDGDVIPLPDGRLLVTSTLRIASENYMGRALYQAAILSLPDGSPDRVDTSFGVDGHWQFALDGVGCALPREVRHSRTTLWAGRVTVVGVGVGGACGAPTTRDYWIARERIEASFVDGFE